MFWKKKKGEKKLSPKEIIMRDLEQLASGNSLVYKMPEIYWTGLGGFVIIEANTKYGEPKQKKYLAFTDQIKDGQPVGKKRQLWSFDAPKDMASWLIERGGERFS